MFHRVLQAVITGIFFTSYFDFVTRYEVYKTLRPEAIINPVSQIGEYDVRGLQAIHFAVEVGNFSATIALIDLFGADINAKTISVINGKAPENIPPGSTPLIISIITGNLELFHYFLSKSRLDLDSSTNELKSPLHFAAEVGNLEMVEALIVKGAKISYMKRTRKSPFHVAVESGQVHVASWLAERNLGLGPVVHSLKSNFFEPMIHFLARQKLETQIWIKMLRIIIAVMEKSDSSRVACIDRKSIQGMTPLQVALEEGNEVAVACLIVFGADLNINEVYDPFFGAIRGFFDNNPITLDYLNPINETVWHLCARINSVALLQALIYYYPIKTNLRRLNSYEQSALDLALEMQNFAVAMELIKLYQNSIDLNVLERYVNISILNYWPDIVDALIKEFPSDFSLIIFSKTNPPMFLHNMATFCMRSYPPEESKRIFLLLIKNYPQMITFHDKMGRTPLHLALQCDFRAFFDWLSEAKIANPELNLNVVDESGESFAESLKKQENTEILNLLNLN